MKWFVICKTCHEKIEDSTSYRGDADIPPFRGKTDMECDRRLDAGCTYRLRAFLSFTHLGSADHTSAHCYRSCEKGYRA